MEFTEVIKNRYSCKKFSDEKVDKEKLNAILEAGRVAPTAKNFQEQHIYVVQSESGLSAIDKATPCRYNASSDIISFMFLALTQDLNSTVSVSFLSNISLNFSSVIIISPSFSINIHI